MLDGAGLSTNYSEAINSLTDRQKEILRLIHAGLVGKEIARQLGISEKTVRNHTEAARNKLEVETSRKAARILAAFETQQGIGTSYLGQSEPIDVPELTVHPVAYDPDTDNTSLPRSPSSGSGEGVPDAGGREPETHDLGRRPGDYEHQEFEIGAERGPDLGNDGSLPRAGAPTRSKLFGYDLRRFTGLQWAALTCLVAVIVIFIVGSLGMALLGVMTVFEKLFSGRLY